MASSATELVVATTILWTRAAPRKRPTTRARAVLPPRSISTLPGKRVLPIRAWIIATILITLLPPTSSPKITLEVRQDLAQCVDYIFNIAVGHAVKHRQADQAFIGGFGHGVLTARISKAIAVVGMMVNRNVMNVHSNILCAQRPEHFGPTGGELSQIQTYWIKMPGGIDIWASLRLQHSGHVAELGGISGRDLPASRKIRFQPLHLLETKCASNVGQAIVESQ